MDPAQPKKLLSFLVFDFLFRILLVDLRSMQNLYSAQSFTKSKRIEPSLITIQFKGPTPNYWITKYPLLGIQI